jgi:acyl-CoA reductase-like NAD-dependent aldehyde dehydrogenase
VASDRKRLTPEERDRIIELKLDRVPVREIAELVDCTVTTVQRTWHAWLDSTAKERAGKLERVRQELIQRQQRIASDARRGAARARGEGKAADEQRFLAEERAALREIARMTGSDAPTKIEQTGSPLQVLWIKEEVDDAPDSASDGA